MALVMQQYQVAQQEGLAVPRVLGLTASPAAGASVAATSVMVEALLAALGSAQLLVVDEREPGLQASAEEEVVTVGGPASLALRLGVQSGAEQGQGQST